MDLLDVVLPYAKNKTSRDDDFIIINTNARSLCPKVNSFIDCFNELDAQLAIVTETWFGDSPRLEQDLDDLLHATGIAMLTKNRAPVGGVSYGGVAIAYRAASVQLQDLRYPNPDCFETIMAAGSMRGHSRKLVVIVAYMPPGDPVQRGRSCLKHISEMVSEAKRRFSEPMIVLSGDFNQWTIGKSLEDYVDLVKVDVGPTRGSRSIDRIFVNFGSAVVSKGTVPPLQTDPDPDGRGSPRLSDHMVCYVRAELQKLRTFEWIKYSYLYYNDDSVEDFRNWIVQQEWEEVKSAIGSNQKAAAYQALVVGALKTFFPTKTTRRRTTDLPWINSKIRKKIKQRKAIFRNEGRSARWRRFKARTDYLIKTRRDNYFVVQKVQILAKGLQ